MGTDKQSPKRLRVAMRKCVFSSPIPGSVSICQNLVVVAKSCLTDCDNFFALAKAVDDLRHPINGQTRSNLSKVRVTRTIDHKDHASVSTRIDHSRVWHCQRT